MFIVLTKSGCVSCKKVIEFLESEGEMYKEYNVEHSTLSEDNLKLLLSTKGRSLLNFIREKSDYFSKNNINPKTLSEDDLSRIVRFNLKEIGSFPIILQLNYSGRVKNCMIGFNVQILRSWIEHQELFNCLVNSNKAYGQDDCCWLCKKQKVLDNIKSGTSVHLKEKNTNEEILSNLKNLKKMNNSLIGKEEQKEQEVNDNHWLLTKYNEARKEILENDEKMKDSYSFFSMENKNKSFIEQLQEEKEATLQKINAKPETEQLVQQEIITSPDWVAAESVEEVEKEEEFIPVENSINDFSHENIPDEPKIEFIQDESNVEHVDQEVDTTFNSPDETKEILVEEQQENLPSSENDEFILPIQEQINEEDENIPIVQPIDKPNERDQDYKFTDKEEYVEEIDVNQYLEEPSVFEEHLLEETKQETTQQHHDGDDNFVSVQSYNEEPVVEVEPEPQIQVDNKIDNQDDDSFVTVQSYNEEPIVEVEPEPQIQDDNKIDVQDDEDDFFILDFENEEPKQQTNIPQTEININHNQQSQVIDEYDGWIEKYRLSESELNHQKAIENDK